MSWWPATLTYQPYRPHHLATILQLLNDHLVGPAQHGLGRLLRQQLLHPLPAELAAVEDGEPGQG